MQQQMGPGVSPIQHQGGVPTAAAQQPAATAPAVAEKQQQQPEETPAGEAVLQAGQQKANGKSHYT